VDAEDTADRVARALAGEAVSPPVAGLSFVPPSALPGPRGDAAAGPARALARTCEDAGLDFAFVPCAEYWSEALVGELHERGVLAFWTVGGMLWPALEELGVEAGLRATVLRPETLKRPMLAALDVSRAMVRRGLALRADAIVVAEDLAGALAPLVPPDFVAADVLPGLALLVSPALDAGVPCVLHSDGDARFLMPGARRTGFVALHGDCGGPEGVARSLGGASAAGLALVGGVPTSGLADPLCAVASGTAAGTLARRGGLLIADDGGITTGEQCAGLLAAIAAARR
jgi:hypothetical protein